jgi:CHAD domain-containing protein
MPYAIQRDENVRDAVLRIMNEQVARARAQLTDAKAPLAKRIHDARKRFKETRAVVRMVRDSLGPQFAVENAWFRDAGRDLAVARDAHAVIEALEKLEGIAPATKKKAQRALTARRDAMSARELKGRITNVLAQLDAVVTRLAFWPLSGESFDSLAGGLARTYRRGRKAMRAAVRSHSPAALHEWRKRVKEHWYHIQLLQYVWPSAMKSYADVLEELSHALGDHHDLFVLRGIIAASPRDFGKPPAVVKLLDAIDARQQDLETRATEIGSRVYAETPKAWLARIRNYWEAWRER